MVPRGLSENFVRGGCEANICSDSGLVFAAVKDLLRNGPVESLTRPALVDRVEALRRLRGAIDAYEARVVWAVDRLGDRGVDGAGMLRSAGRVSSRTAARASKRAESLEELPATRDALVEGRITAEHVDAIAAAAEIVTPEQAYAELVQQAEAAPADKLAKDSRQWATNNRDDNGADEHAAQLSNRSAHKWVQRTGLKMHSFHAQLDRVDGQTVAASLQKRYDELLNDDNSPGGDPDQARTPQQRMADAFVSLITGATADNPDRRPHPKYQLNAVYDIAGQTTTNGDPLASLVVDGEPLPSEVLERVACDSTITPIVFNGPAKPIWVGHDYRTATIGQWKALIARDRGCVGCGAAPDRCEAHHIVAWQDDGPTNIDNLVLVCSRCHHDLHDRNMVLRQTGGHWTTTNRTRPAQPTRPDTSPGPGKQLTLTA